MSWTDPTQNTDGSTLSNLSHIVVHYGCNGPLNQNATVLPGVEQRTLTDLPDGTCRFAAVAVNAEGVVSDFSNEASIAFEQGLPGQVANLVVTWAESGELMVAEVTGSVSIVSANGAQSGSTSVTVPADAELAIAFYNYFESSDSGTPTLTINGVALTSAVHSPSNSPSGAAAGGIKYLVSPATGNQTFAWNWTSGGARQDGGGIYIVYAKGVDIADLVRDADAEGAADEGSVSLTIDSADTDLVLAMAASFNEAPEITSAATSLVNNSAINSHQTDIDVMTAGASSTAIVVTGLEYSASAAISLKAAAGGGEEVEESFSGAVDFADAHASRTDLVDTVTGQADLTASLLSRTDVLDAMSGQADFTDAFAGSIATADAFAAEVTFSAEKTAVIGKLAALEASVDFGATHESVIEIADALAGQVDLDGTFGDGSSAVVSFGGNVDLAAALVSTVAVNDAVAGAIDATDSWTALVDAVASVSNAADFADVYGSLIAVGIEESHAVELASAFALTAGEIAAVYRVLVEARERRVTVPSRLKLIQVSNRLRRYVVKKPN